jgi:hypothetical protein
MTSKIGTRSGSGEGRLCDHDDANPAAANRLSIPTKCWDSEAGRAFDAGALVHYGAAASNDR